MSYLPAENWCPKCGTGVTVDAGGECRSCGEHQAACNEWEGECYGCDWHLLLASHARVVELEAEVNREIDCNIGRGLEIERLTARLSAAQLEAASVNGDMARLLEWLRAADLYEQVMRQLAAKKEGTDGE